VSGSGVRGRFPGRDNGEGGEDAQNEEELPAEQNGHIQNLRRPESGNPVALSTLSTGLSTAM
jgi:hypothetical protein